MQIESPLTVIQPPGLFPSHLPSFILPREWAVRSTKDMLITGLAISFFIALTHFVFNYIYKAFKGIKEYSDKTAAKKREFQENDHKGITTPTPKNQVATSTQIQRDFPIRNRFTGSPAKDFTDAGLQSRKNSPRKILEDQFKFIPCKSLYEALMTQSPFRRESLLEKLKKEWIPINESDEKDDITAMLHHLNITVTANPIQALKDYLAMLDENGINELHLPLFQKLGLTIYIYHRETQLRTKEGWLLPDSTNCKVSSGTELYLFRETKEGPWFRMDPIYSEN